MWQHLMALAPALALGFVLALLVSILAWWRGTLSLSGLIGALIIGTVLFGLGGWAAAVALVSFFVSASSLSKIFHLKKAGVEKEYAKGGTRDLGQTMANGAVAAILATLFGVTGDERFLAALLGAVAAANADTWATELGVLSAFPPRLITTLRQVPPGTSGGISLAGLLASIGGAAFVGIAAAITDRSLWGHLPWITMAGLIGSLADSLLGATLQTRFWCPLCKKETERATHHCGSDTLHYKGLRWLGNDMVNLLATAVGAGISYFAV